MRLEQNFTNYQKISNTSSHNDMYVWRSSSRLAILCYSICIIGRWRTVFHEGQSQKD